MTSKLLIVLFALTLWGCDKSPQQLEWDKQNRTHEEQMQYLQYIRRGQVFKYAEKATLLEETEKFTKWRVPIYGSPEWVYITVINDTVVSVWRGR